MAKKAGKELKDSFITFWNEQIEGGKKYMKKYSTQPKWKEWRQHYRGDWNANVIPVNRTFSYGRTMIPRVYFRAPRVSITAARPEFVGHAIVLEAVDNMLIQALNLKKTLKSAILQAFLSGTAPIKLGYDSEFGYLPEQAIDQDTATATQLSRKEKRMIEYNLNVKPGMPWAMTAMPEDVIIPFGYKDPDNLPWIAHRVIRPLKDVQEDQKYQNTKDLKGSLRTNLELQRTSPFDQVRDTLFTELYEIRSYHTKEIIVICEDQLLLKSDDALQYHGLPWEFLTFNEDPEYFWGIPDVYILEPQQNELNEVKTQQSRHRKIALLKFLYNKGAITEDQMAHLLSGEVGPAIGLDAEQLQAAVITLQPHMPQELWLEAQHIVNDMRESMGYSENQAGGYNRKGGNVSATETAEIAAGVDLRTDERKDIVADVMLNIVKKWNDMVFNFWDTERVIEIVGPEGGVQWIEFTGDQIKCEYKVHIDIDSGFPMTAASKRQLADGLFKTYGGDPMMDQMGVRKFHLQQYENLAPGITHLLRNPNVPPTDAAMLGAARQPNPAFGGQGAGNSPGTNQGGGRGPINFEKFNTPGGKK